MDGFQLNSHNWTTIDNWANYDAQPVSGIDPAFYCVVKSEPIETEPPVIIKDLFPVNLLPDWTVEHPYIEGSQDDCKILKNEDDNYSDNDSFQSEFYDDSSSESEYSYYENRNRRKKNNTIRNFKCPVCSILFRIATQYENHLKIHTDELPYACTDKICGNRFKDTKELEEHFDYEHKLIHEKCTICSKVFFKKITFENHMKLHTEKTNIGKETRKNTYECSKCSSKLRSSSSFKKHLLAHESENARFKNLECHLCIKRFSLESNFNIHVFDHISNNLPFNCIWQDCKKQFALKQYLFAHMKLHFRNKSRETLEQQTIKSNDTMNEKKNSLKNQPNSETERPTKNDNTHILKYKCPLCNTNFGPTLDHMINFHAENIMSVPTEPEVYKCSWKNCNETYKTLCDITTHFVSHTGQAILKCSECEQKFITERDLKRHKTDCAAAKRKHNCLICKKSFSLKKVLTIHMLAHSENVSFKRRSKLDDHSKERVSKKTKQTTSNPTKRKLVVLLKKMNYEL